MDFFFSSNQYKQLKPFLFKHALWAAGLPRSDASQMEELQHLHQSKPLRNPCVFISLKLFQRQKKKEEKKKQALPYFVLYFRKFKWSNILFLFNVPQSAKW